MQELKSLFVTLCVIGLAFAEQSPVFLWGVNSVAKPSLPTIPQTEFTELVTPLLADKTLIVFLENRLTNKDFVCSNPTTEKSCYAFLRGVQSKTFYASVESPVEALRSVAGEREFNTVDASGKFANPLELSEGKVVFVNFEEPVESNVRGATLESHDSIIAAVTSQYDKNVIFMYTSAPSSDSSTVLKRQRRDTTAASTQGYVFRQGADLLLFYTTLTVSNGQLPTPTPLEISSMSVTQQNNTAMTVTLTPTTGSPLKFDITLAGGYFFMTNVEYNGMKFRSTEVYSPTDFSYFCGNLTLSSVVTEDQPVAYTLKWNSFQFQAPFGRTTNENFVFGDPWHCVGFFTGGILSGLLIVALLLTITFIGVCWMMDINTMDRFDDPKGKTISINASE